MDVTEVRIKPAGDRDEKLLAYCSVTFDDCFVVRDLKIIQGSQGVFVAMPSRKLTDLCPDCRAKNHLRARYCNECGRALAPDRAEHNAQGRAKLHADIAHPIHAAFREELQRRILQAYEQEQARARQPGYEPAQDDFPDLGPSQAAHEPSEKPVEKPKDGPAPGSDAKPRHAVPTEPHEFGEGIPP